MPYFESSVIYVDSAVFTAATDSGLAIQGFYESSITAVQDGDVGVLAMDANRRLLVSLEVDNVGIGGGTQYTEDAAAAANPVGNAQILVRADTPASITTTNGDNVAQRGTDYGAAYCQIVDSSGNFVDSFGGGTQYTEGATDASITGTAAMMEVAADTLQPVQGTVADGLLVNLGTNNDVTLATLPDTAASDLATISGDTTSLDGKVTTGGGTEASAILVTVASDSTGVLTVDNAGTFATQIDGAALTALQLIDDPVATISATPLQRVAIFDDADTQITSFGGGTQYTEGDTDASITGTAAMMEVSADTLQPIQGTVADGLLVNLGTNNDVTLATLPDTAAGDLAAINAALAGTLTVGTHAVTLATLPDTAAGDLAAINTAVSGTLTVGSHAVTNAGTFAVQVDGDALTALQLIDDPVATISATDVMRVAIYNDSDTQITSFGGTEYTEDDPAPANPTGPLLMARRNDSAGSSHTDTDGDVIALSARNTGELRVYQNTTPDTASGDLAAINTAVSGTLSTQGNVAHDAVDSGSPIKMGGKASTSEPSAVANGDRVDAYYDELGYQYVKQVALTPHFDSDADNTAQTMKASAGVLHFLEVQNSNTVDCWIQLFDESGAITVGTTTPKLSFLVPAGTASLSGAMDKIFSAPITFANSIKYACTTTATGNGDPTTGLVVNGGYV